MRMALAALVVAGVAGLMAYVRLAPDEVARWHVALPPVAGEATAAAAGLSEVPGGAVGFVPSDAPGAALQRLAEVAAAAPRTRVLAGDVAGGRITWVARSALWGFPDYITAEVAPGGVRLWSRQRYGRGDQGVNLARLADWVARL